MMMLTRLFIVFLAMITSSELRAQTAAAINASPVAFTTFRSSMPDEKAAPIIESMTRHLRSAIVDVYANEMIGSMSEFAPQLPPAVLGSSGYAIGEIDRAIDTRVMPDIRPVLKSLSDDEVIKFDIEFMWADAVALEQLPASSLSTSALIGVLRMSGRQDAATLLDMRWLDIDEHDPKGALRKRLQSAELLKQLVSGRKGEWTPWTATVKMIIDRDGIRIDQEGLLIPAGFFKPTRIEKPGVVVEMVTYAPLHFPYNKDGTIGPTDMARLSFKRHYGSEEQHNDSDLRLAFGQWTPEGFKIVESAKCARMVERIPTIHGRVVFAESTWWGSVVGWLRSWFVTQISTKILLQDLSISYDRDTHKISVDPRKSIIPIIVSSNDVFSGGKPYVLDPRAGVFGINLYERFVGSQIADGLSADLNKTLSDADAALSQMIMGIAGGIVE
jgi:hypothetical protein